MDSASSITLARISGLLDAIEASARSLRQYVQGQRHDSTTDQPGGYAARIAQNLELPFHGDSKIVDQAAILRIACERLGRLATPPRHLVFEAAGSFYTTLALQIVLKHDLATLIKVQSDDLGVEGVSVVDLAIKCKLDSDLLARLLRYLSQHGIFQELQPGFFANTAASSTLINNPEFKAHLDLVMHEGQLAAPHFEEFMAQRFEASHGSHSAPSPLSAFALFSEGEPVYKWLHLPANSDRGKNFNLAMRGMSRTEGLDFLPVDYPFGSFVAHTVLVDVGGGIGSLAELLLPEVPNLRFVVQDLEPVVTLANEVASPSMKNWITQGKVKFQVHDCFSPQPQSLQGAVFVLKNMIHNYPDSKAIEILAAIRPSEPSKLLIIDRLVTPLFRTEATTNIGEQDIYRRLRVGIQAFEDGGDVEGASPSSQGIPTMYDLIMGSLHGGRTRKLEEWRKLLLDGGFRLVKIYPLRASTGQAVLEAVPI